MFTAIADTAFSLIDRIAAGRALGLSRRALLRAYYFEVTSNLDILDLADIPALKNAGADDPAFAALLGGLETEIALTVLFSDAAPCRELYALLETAGELEETAETDGEEAVPARVSKSVLSAMLFTVRKIAVLRKAASLLPGSLSKTPRLAVRVGNIRRHLAFISGKLREIDGREPFLIR